MPEITEDDVMKGFEESDRELRRLYFMAESTEEILASIDGQIAMMTLFKSEAPPEVRFAAWHKLRTAAKTCPNAAYNLGLFFNDSERYRDRRRKKALRLYEHAYKVGLARMKDAGKSFEEANRDEEMLRDIVSRAITNIGVDFSQRGDVVSALQYFRLGAKLYPANANAQVCLGRMAIFANKETKADPLEGLRAWKTATETQPSCLNNSSDCDCLKNLVRVADGVRTRYGEDQARDYLLTRVRSRHADGAGTAFRTVASEARELKELGCKPLSPKAAAASESLATMEAAMGRSHPLETRVTIAATLLGHLAVIDGREVGDRAMIDRSRELCSGFEPLRPFLGDHEWADVSPPRSSHLMKPEVATDICRRVGLAVDCLRADVPGIGPEDAMTGFLFHLDPHFRFGVANMAQVTFSEGYWSASSGRELYIPAMNISGRHED
jgi:tetratricopeptide (TPR) repeat protein